MPYKKYINLILKKIYMYRRYTTYEVYLKTISLTTFETRTISKKDYPSAIPGKCSFLTNKTVTLTIFVQSLRLLNTVY